MEIAVYLLAVLLTALSVALFLLMRKIRKERNDNKSLSALINASQVYTVTWRTDFSLIEANQPLKEFLLSIGRTADESFLRNLFLDNDSLGTTGSVLLMGAMSDEGRRTVFNLSDGTVRHILWKSRIVSRGDVYTTVATTGTDITNEYVIKKELDEAKQQEAIASESLDIAASSADIGIMTIMHNATGYELIISENGRRMLGTAAEIRFESFTVHISSNDKKIFCDTIRDLFRGIKTSEVIDINIRISESAIHHFIFRMKVTSSAEKDLNRVTAAFIDATGEKENIGSGRRGSSEDPLTGFSDRNGFFNAGEEFIKKAAADNRTPVMICIRLERYKKISTLFGMETADKLLLTYSQGMEKCVIKPALFGRISLDDFAVLMTCKNTEETEKFAKELQIFIENACNGTILPAILCDQSGFIAGACLGEDGDDIITLYNKANMMLLTDYTDKKTVCRYFDKTIEEKIYNRENIEEELKRAIINGEFELYYQPKVTFNDSGLKGAEALIRWNHPINGIKTPMSFIPIAEEAGLITKIDEWGLKEACRQTKLWQDKGYTPIRVSVNMSQAQFYQTDVVSTISSALRETGLRPEYLEVELTETMAMQDIERTISILKEIQSMGVSVSMDDFGTGYSSLSALKLLPINILKIDRSLIYDININETSYSIVKAIVELGRALDLEVLAEGVETKEQSEVLSELGCNIAQGYFYGKPLSASDMERMFLKKS